MCQVALHTENPWHEKNLFWGTATGWVTLVIAGIGTGVSGAGMIARFLFVAAVPFGWIAIWCAFSLLSNRTAKLLLRLVSCLLCAAVTWLVASNTIREPMELTLSQKREFTNILKTGLAAPPAYTIISCPDADEQTCIFAATFIPVFQRAGWKIEGPQVERARITVPEKSISIVGYGPPLVDPQDPDHGVWTQVHPWMQTLSTAFKMVGITPIAQNDPLLPRNKVRIYFGSIPQK